MARESSAWLERGEDDGWAFLAHPPTNATTTSSLRPFRIESKGNAETPYFCLMREWLLASDKLNAVIVVLLLIWGGIAAHLGYLTRKVHMLEKTLDKMA